MEEILPGIFHWTTFHEGIRADVHSYYIAAAHPALLIDPRVPKQGLKWFAGRPRRSPSTSPDWASRIAQGRSVAGGGSH